MPSCPPLPEGREREAGNMRQHKLQQDYTRRQLLTDCVTAYIRNNPKEYEQFLAIVDYKKAALYDKEFGEFTEDKKKGSQDGFRLAFSFPDKLMNAIDVLLKAHQQEKFGEPKGEMKWFSKQFPQFLIPNKY